MKITIKNILKENVNDREEEAYQKFLKGVAKRIKPPYIKNMVAYGVPELDWHEVFDEIFGVGVYVYTNSSNTEYQVIDNQHKMKRTQIRHQQKEDVFFDGRFVSRVEKPKNLYTRKIKHKKSNF